MMITVFAIMTAKPGKKQQLLAMSRANLATVRAEAGCHGYSLVEDMANVGPFQTLLGDDSFAFIENWESKQALEKHLVTPHMKAYFEQAEPLLVNKVIHVLQSAE